MELEELRTMNYAVAEETVLELAAGAGDTGFEAAAILGDEGRLVCTDFSPRMLDAARRRGAELGRERRPPADRCRADRARRPLGGRRALPGIFSMASAQRTTALLDGAGFTDLRTEELAVRFSVDDVDEYLGFVGDTAGPIAIALRDVPGDERAQIEARLREAFAPFATTGGYALPGVVLAAVAS